MQAAREKTFVKICGITRLSDARVAVRAGANALGFVFAPSPRRVSPARAAGIATHVHPAVRKIGVFVDAGWDRIIELIDAVGLDGVQLHGEESQEFVDELKSARRNLFISKVFRMIDDRFVEAASAFNADAILLDSKDVANPATSGPVISAELLQAVKGPRVVVAGGLTPDNVGDLIQRVHPWGVDVSGGVESELGKKSPDKVRDFVRAVRQAESV